MESVVTAINAGWRRCVFSSCAARLCAVRTLSLQFRSFAIRLAGFATLCQGVFLGSNFRYAFVPQILSRLRDRSPLRLIAVVACLAVAPAKAGPPFLVSSSVALPGRITDLVMDGQGNSVVAGVIGSYTTAGIDTGAITNGGMDLRFVARVNTLARTPAFVAIVGAPTKSISGARANDFGKDEAAGIALDRSGNAYIVAYDGSKDYPVSGGQYASTTGKKYVFKVTATGVVSRFSLALDSAINRVGAIAIDAAGATYVTGSAYDGLQTTPGAPYPTSSVAQGCIAPYILKLDASGQNVVYATYLGTSGLPGQICGGRVAGIADPKYLDPTGFALALDASGNVYVAGQAEPGLAATPGAVSFGTKVGGVSPNNGRSIDQASHAFVTKLNATGTAVVFTARLGGSLRDRATSLLIDGTGAVLVAGKTSSHDFPTIGGGLGFPFVLTSCALWVPEVGFLSRLSADGTQLMFSTFLPLDGGQLDDCQGWNAPFAPAKIALDSQGNIVLLGATTPSNRLISRSLDAIVPEPTGSQSDIGDELLQVLSADGHTLIYSSPLVGGGVVRDLAIDPWQSLIVAAGSTLSRISPGAMPVAMTITPYPACAGEAATLTASVAASNDIGTVDFQVDGASVGSATISGGKATKSLQLNVGVRQLKAIYHGSGAFDGASSTIGYLGVNQAGACQ